MKFTKRVLAIVMALGLVVCMAAMAFATEATTAEQKVESKYSVEVLREGKNVTAYIYACDFTNLNSGTVTLDTVNLNYKKAENGTDAELCAKGVFADNGFSSETNGKITDKVIYGFFFKEALWDAQKFEAQRVDKDIPADKQEKVNATKFQLAVISFEMIDENTPFTITATSTAKFVDGTTTELVVVGPAEKPAEVTTAQEETSKSTPTDAVTTTAPTVTTTNAPTTTSAPTTKAPIKTDGGQSTGDNGILAVVAGIALMGGAALVITKKRK